ncbi:hypothetical protein sS8_5526 [Methylocaldum marinum]|uniref:Uncharacterized protein n=2 Tax=Methylocaldum marinum TaxID=1432792 RepID=A0A250L0I0_9GAMM|nr:hypothetical protein sS8_5526 [Methylocaldum marinum]
MQARPPLTPNREANIMNSESTTKVESNPTEISRSQVEHTEETAKSDEYPFYIVPRPPIPGKTAWSIAG